MDKDPMTRSPFFKIEANNKQEQTEQRNTLQHRTAAKHLHLREQTDELLILRLETSEVTKALSPVEVLCQDK